MQTERKKNLRGTPSLTDVDGMLVGHFTCRERPTGCTVITSRAAFSAGVDVRGGAPGTRETDLLRAENTVEAVNAIVLAGGSAFGLDAATGVVKYLEEQGLGFETRVVKVPIVCGAILFDLSLGDPKIRPDAASGYAAAKGASSDPVGEGNIGAGAGATVGKMFGMDLAMKAGLGSWSLSRADGLKVGALVALNCAGDVVNPSSGKIIAGARNPKGGFMGTMERLRQEGRTGFPGRDNTVLGVVATNAALGKAQCTKVAQMAQDALARCIYPSHTPWDGDTVFAIATGHWNSEKNPVDPGLIGALAADVLATAILRAAEKADSWGPYPAARDYPAKA
jgi:L-aminopeptidase/D-esterase-like protein